MLTFISLIVILLPNSFRTVEYKSKIDRCEVVRHFNNRGASYIWCLNQEKIVIPISKKANKDTEFLTLEKNDIIIKHVETDKFKVIRQGNTNEFYMVR